MTDADAEELGGGWVGMHYLADDFEDAWDEEEEDGMHGDASGWAGPDGHMFMNSQSPVAADVNDLMEELFNVHNRALDTVLIHDGSRGR